MSYPEDSSCCSKLTQYPIAKQLVKTVIFTGYLIIFTFIGGAIFLLAEQSFDSEIEKAATQNVSSSRQKVLQLVRSSAENINNDTLTVLSELLDNYEESLYWAFTEGLHVSGGDEEHENLWGFWSSSFFCATVYSTIGYGHLIPKTDVGKMLTIPYALVGIPLFLKVVLTIEKLITLLIIKAYQSICLSFCPPEEREELVDLRRDSFDERIKTNRINLDGCNHGVLFFIAVFLGISYMCIGAAIFTSYEPWGFLNSFYLLFISISTIGFGDFVPTHPEFMFLSAFYILFGVSMMASVLDLGLLWYTSSIEKTQKTKCNNSCSLFCQ